MRIDISEILRFFEVEDCIKLLRFLRIYPQKTSKFEVRMRSIVLRFFEDSSKSLEKYSLRGIYKLHRQILEPFLTSHLSLIDKRSKKKEDIYLKDINI